MGNLKSLNYLPYGKLNLMFLLGRNGGKHEGKNFKNIKG